MSTNVSHITFPGNSSGWFAGQTNKLAWSDLSPNWTSYHLAPPAPDQPFVFNATLFERGYDCRRGCDTNFTATWGPLYGYTNTTYVALPSGVPPNKTWSVQFDFLRSPSQSSSNKSNSSSGGGGGDEGDTGTDQRFGTIYVFASADNFTITNGTAPPAAGKGLPPFDVFPKSSGSSSALTLLRHDVMAAGLLLTTTAALALCI
ncbi:unnamed protein product [Parajaminaea phylloscopi]